MAGLADISADDIMSSDDTGPNSVTLAGPGSVQVSGESNAPHTQAQEVVEQEPSLSGTSEVLDSAAIEKLLSKPVQADQKAPERADEVQPDETEKPQDKKKLSPSQARIVQLIQERNRANEQAAQLAAQVAEIQRQTVEQQAKFQQEQLALERQRIAMMEEARQQEAESRLSDVERAKRAFLREAEEKATSKLSPELKAMQEKIAAFEAEREAAREAAEQQKRNEYFKQEAQAVLGGMLLKDFAVEEQQALGPGMEEMLYAFSGAFGVTPARAAPVFKQFLDKYVKAENGRLSRSAGTKVAESRQTVRSVPSARATGGTPRTMTGNITLSDLARGTADGRTFDNFVQYNAAGRPPLRSA